MTLRPTVGGSRESTETFDCVNSEDGHEGHVIRRT